MQSIILIRFLSVLKFNFQLGKIVNSTKDTLAALKIVTVAMWIRMVEVYLVCWKDSMLYLHMSVPLRIKFVTNVKYFVRSKLSSASNLNKHELISDMLLSISFKLLERNTSIVSMVHVTRRKDAFVKIVGVVKHVLNTVSILMRAKAVWKNYSFSRRSKRVLELFVWILSKILVTQTVVKNRILFDYR